MKSITNFKKREFDKELSNDKLNKIYGGESSSDTTTTDTTTDAAINANLTVPSETTTITKVVHVGNTIVDDLNGLIR